jgi:hypothetical protein
MDRYGAHGELLASEHSQSCLGPFLVDSGTDRGYEFNDDGSTTVWERGKGSWVEPKPGDDRYKLTRDEYASCISDNFYRGHYHDWACAESYFDELVIMQSVKCKGFLSIGWSEWISWASKIMRDVLIDEQTR